MAELPINFVDVLVLLCLLLSAVLAFVRGCVHEVLAIGAWVGAAFATLYLFPAVQPYARQIIAIDLLADIVAGALIFVVILVLLSIITRILANQVRNSSLGALDRSLGLVFGLVRGAVIVSLAWLVVIWALPQPEERPAYLQEAKSRRFAEIGANLILAVLPDALAGRGAEALDDAGRRARRAQELKESYESLSRPEPKDGAPDADKGYNEDARNEMDRLIESQTSESGNGKP